MAQGLGSCQYCGASTDSFGVCHNPQCQQNAFNQQLMAAALNVSQTEQQATEMMKSLQDNVTNEDLLKKLAAIEAKVSVIFNHLFREIDGPDRTTATDAPASKDAE